jgi:hypothetical protein
MIAPRRRAHRLVAGAEAFSIPQIMAFSVPAVVRDKRRECQKAKLPFVFSALHRTLVSTRLNLPARQAKLLPLPKRPIGAGRPKPAACARKISGNAKRHENLRAAANSLSP